MEDPDSSRSSSRRLEFTKNDFDDFLIALMAKLRVNSVADRILSGELHHPLIRFQLENAAALQQLNVPFFAPANLLQNPAECHVNFLRLFTSALLRAPAPVPDFGEALNALQEEADVFRQGERFIYSTIVATLKVGDSMHYARQCPFGAGQILLQTIVNDNRQVTTRSLMAVFSALMCLSLRDEENFDQFARRIELLIQRLQNWRPPVILPEQLLLFCALRALPAVPYGPVRHIILASPRITFMTGMSMLRDVANTGGELIANTLGSGSSSSKPAAVLCATPCDDPKPAPRSRHQQRQRRQERRPRSRQNDKPPLYTIEGPCVHHGPNARHATSECRDPGLTKRKKKKPTPAQASAAAFATTTQPAPRHDDVMYSEIFVTTVSKAATRFPRATFTPARRVRTHLQRPRRNHSASRFAVNTVSMELCDDCIATYTRPIPGSFSPAPESRPVTPSRLPRRKRRTRRRRANRRVQHRLPRRERRAHRRRTNRRINYPSGKFDPVRPRLSRPVDTYDPRRAVSRRRRRRDLETKNSQARLHELFRSAGIELPEPLPVPSKNTRPNRKSRSKTKPKLKSRRRRRPPCKWYRVRPSPANGSCPAPCSASRVNGGYPVNPTSTEPCRTPRAPPPVVESTTPALVASPELSQGQAVIQAAGICSTAHLYFAINASESCVTTAALPAGVELVPRALPPNTPVFLSGLTGHDLRHVAAKQGTFSHYAVADVQVTVCTVNHPTLLPAVPLRVVQSDFPAVILGTNNIVNWHAPPPRPLGAYFDADAESVRSDCVDLIKSLLSDHATPPVRVFRVIRKEVSAPACDSLVLAVKWGISENSWHWTRQVCEDLSFWDAVGLRETLEALAAPSSTTSASDVLPPSPPPPPPPCGPGGPSPRNRGSAPPPNLPTASSSASPSAAPTSVPSHTLSSDIEVAAWCAFTSRPSSKESITDSHLRIGASFAAHSQLEEFRLAKLTRPDLQHGNPVFVLSGIIRGNDRPQGTTTSSSSSTDDDPALLATAPTETAHAAPVAAPSTAVPSASVPPTPTPAIVVPELPPAIDVPQHSASDAFSATSAAYVPPPVPGLSHDVVTRPERSHWPFYGVAKGISPFVYETWEACKANTHGVPRALYKGFLTRPEAATFVNENFEILKRRSAAPKRGRFRGHGWSKKGTKASRSRAKYTHKRRAPQPERSTGVSSAASASSSALPSSHSSTTSVSSHKVTSASVAASASSSSSTSVPRATHPGPRTARAVYCWAEGFSTTLQFPQQFLVRLTGEPPLPQRSRQPDNDPAAASAISSVISAVRHLEANPRSLCNHPGCIYNQGTYHERRELLLRSLRLLEREHRASLDEFHAFVTSYTSPTGDILDSGAARHVEPNARRLQGLSPCPPVSLIGINGSPCKITQHGTVGGFHNVLHAPSAVASVRSVGALLDSRDHNLLFRRADALLVPRAAPSAAAVKVAIRKEDGLYHIVRNAVPPPSVLTLLSVPQQIKRERVHQLHRTLAHASPRRMRQVLTAHPNVDPSLLPKDVQLFTSCSACALGNASRPPRPPRAAVRATAFGYRIHFDTSGTVRPATSSGFARVLVAVDDASRWIFVVLMRNATMEATSRAMRHILRLASATHSVLRTKVIRCDNGTEFKNRLVDAFVVEANLQREFTCVGTSHQNGVAEVAIRKLFAVARTMLVDASLPPKFWGEAIMTAAHVHNRMPCRSNPDNASPFEIRHGLLPDLRHLRPFGITAFVRIKEHITKVMPRAQQGILLGYGHAISSQKGWRILLPDTNNVVTTTDATFGKSLADSIASRDDELTSTDVLDVGERSVSSPSSRAGMPNSLNFTDQPHPKRRPVTRSMAAPKPEPTPVPTPAAIGAAAPAADIGQSSPATITKPTAVHVKPDPDEPVATPVVHKRPVGRPPANSRWDVNLGRYVRVMSATKLPTLSQVWSLVTRKVTDDPETPVTYHEAVTGPDRAHWLKAIASELQSLRKHNTWRVIDVADLPAGARRIKTKWVFKIKRGQDGQILKYKARLTACGYAQRYGRDYDETFSPVASTTSIRTAFAIAAARGYFLAQHDVATAFLYGKLPANQRVYLYCPHGVDLKPTQCLEALQGIYGLRQAPRLFNQHLHSVLAKLHYQQSLSDPCVYFKCDADTFSMLVVVVDDILHVASSKAILAQFSTLMAKTYDFKNLGVPSLMIGVNIVVSPTSIRLDQAHYIRTLADKFGQISAAKVSCPASLHGCLGSAPCANSEPLDVSRFPYLSLVGGLLWATITRPDVAAVVSRACQHSKAPSRAHWRAAIRILRYLLATAKLAIVYRRSVRPIIVSGYADAAFANEMQQRSRYGHALYVSDCLVCWLTKATTAVCLSTAEAEFIAAAEAVKDLLWLRNFLQELGFPQLQPSKLREDNQACVAMVSNHVVTGRNRHFCVKMAWLREQVASKVVSLVFVSGRNNVADIFTKVLAVASHARLTLALLCPGDVLLRGE